MAYPLTSRGEGGEKKRNHYLDRVEGGRCFGGLPLIQAITTKEVNLMASQNPLDVYNLLLSGKTLWKKWRRAYADVQASEPDLRQAQLRGVDLCGYDLHNADLTEADLQEAILQEVNLQEADLRHADLRNADLSDANLQKANL